MDQLSKLMQGVQGRPAPGGAAPPPGAPGGRAVGVPTSPEAGAKTDAAGRPKSDSVRVTIPASLFVRGAGPTGPAGTTPPPGQAGAEPPAPDPQRAAIMRAILAAQQNRSPTI